MKYRQVILFMVVLPLFSCKEDVLPKPKAMLSLDYPHPKYRPLEANCEYTFEMNGISELKDENDCSLVLDYPLMNASIFITYKKVEDNVRQLLIDAQKLTYEHVVKADNIESKEYINPDAKVYGMFYKLSGDAASQSQFYVTDSTDHFVTGSLYFYVKPNYDSILPAADYLQKDIQRIMETLRWEN